MNACFRWAIALITLLAASAAQSASCSAVEKAPIDAQSNMSTAGSVDGCVVPKRDPSTQLAGVSDAHQFQQHYSGDHHANPV